MQFKDFTQWEVVSILQIIWFFGAFVACICTFIKIKPSITKWKPPILFFLFYALFVICKVVGGILGLVILHSATFNVSMYTAAYIFDSISMGFITRSLFPFIEYFYDDQNEDSKQFDMESQASAPPRSRLHPFRILTLLLMVGIICTTVGATSNGDSGLTTRKAGALLLIATVVLLYGIIIFFYWTKEDFEYVFWQLISITTLLLIRCIYTVVVAFDGVAIGSVSKYSLLLGDYEYFTFLALLVEAVVTILLLWVMILFSKHYRI